MRTTSVERADRRFKRVWTPEEAAKVWKAGQRRDVALHCIRLRKPAAMAFAVAFVRATGDTEDLGRLISMMLSIRERNQL
jgi:hypothetical protein